MLSFVYVCVLLFRGIGYSTIPINLVLVYKITIIYVKKRGETSQDYKMCLLELDSIKFFFCFLVSFLI